MADYHNIVIVMDMGKSSILIPFIGVFLTVFIVYILRNSVTNSVIIDIYGGSALAYFVGLIHASLLTSDLIYFFIPWLITSSLIGYISRTALKGGLGASLLIPTAMICFVLFGFLYNPTVFDTFFNNFTLLLTDNLHWFTIGIVSSGVLGGVVGRLRKEPEMLSSDLSGQHMDPVSHTCPKCGATYLSNVVYCRQCGYNMDEATKGGE